ncbi:hypothetical protein FRX31_008224 [Thalictrum thalictroides]|uniref:Uncharacterized protein n=1 Tax=Thalictrum thalictroides TaxID=46969 RepID=A0A7J6WXL2_THATH|nr:hypothetical protein FRX31_008224 [Thalictrum thalictroides]
MSHRRPIYTITYKKNIVIDIKSLVYLTNARRKAYCDSGDGQTPCESLTHFRVSFPLCGERGREDYEQDGKEMDGWTAGSMIYQIKLLASRRGEKPMES